MMLAAQRTSVGAMIETYRMLGREREADLLREAQRLHRLGRRRWHRLRMAPPRWSGSRARRRTLVLVRCLVRARNYSA
jgi:hypothetical protein